MFDLQCFNTLGKHQLRNKLGKGSSATKNEILDWFNNEENWEFYQVSKHFNYTSHSEFPEENFNWCKKWCEDNEARINFDTPITFGEGNSYTIEYLFQFYVVLMLYTGVKPSYKTSIKLIRYIGYFDEYTFNRNKSKENISLIGKLKEILSPDIIFNEIKKLLQEGVYDTISLQGLLKYIEQHKLVGVKEELPAYMLNKKIDYYIRNRFFNIYIDLGGTYHDSLLGYLDFIKGIGQIGWEILQYLSKHNPITVGQWLINNYEKLQFSVNDVCVLLYQYSPQDAMEIYIKTLEDTKTTFSDPFRENGNLLEELNPIQVDHEELKDFLFKILEIYVKQDFKPGEHDNTIRQVFECLKRLFTTNEDNSLVGEVDRFVNKLRMTSYSPDNLSTIETFKVYFIKYCEKEMDKGKKFRKALSEAKSVLDV